jgi:hypothetical protein
MAIGLRNNHMSSKWRLEIHDETKGRGSIPTHFKSDHFPSLRFKIVEHRGQAFWVRAPQASQTDLTGLLDLRRQGFNVKRD